MAALISSFLALTAAPVAMAAETPQTEVQVATVATRALLSILSTRVPYRYIKIITSGGTVQATPSPCVPRVSTRLKRISAPRSTKPVSYTHLDVYKRQVPTLPAALAVGSIGL